MRPRRHFDFDRLTTEALSAVDARDFEKVKELLDEGAVAAKVIFKCARLGCHAMVDVMLKENRGLINAAVRGYALRQDVARVDILLLHGADREVAAKAYADVMRADLAEKQSKQGVPYDMLVTRYESSLHLCSGAKVLRLLALTESDTNRWKIETRAYKHLYKHDKPYLYRQLSGEKPVSLSGAPVPKIMCKLAARVHLIMRKYKLGMDEAIVLMAPNIMGAICWLLQGENTLNSPVKLPFDVMIIISSHVFDLSSQQTRNLYQFLCGHTYEGALAKIDSKYKQHWIAQLGSRIFTPTEYEAQIDAKKVDHAQLDARYQGKHRRIGAP